MSTVTIWDRATIIKHEDEDARIPPDSHFVLYTIAPDAESPSTSHVRRPVASSSNSALQRPTKRVNAPYPPPIIAATRFRLPLPAGNDPTFRHEVRVDGKPGLQLSKCCTVGEDVDQLRLLTTILMGVEGARAPMDHLCYGPYVWVERAYFPNETGGAHADRRAVNKHALGRNITHGRILALMAEKQFKHWCDMSLFDEVDLEPLLGSAAWWAKGARVGWDSVYIVAIRRYQSKAPDGSIRWFPELEMRVTC